MEVRRRRCSAMRGRMRSASLHCCIATSCTPTKLRQSLGPPFYEVLSDKFVAVNVWYGSQMARLRPQPACWYHRNRSNGPFPGTYETISHDMSMHQSLGAHEPCTPTAILYMIDMSSTPRPASLLSYTYDHKVCILLVFIWCSSIVFLLFFKAV
jgi:hypothetical protein